MGVTLEETCIVLKRWDSGEVFALHAVHLSLIPSTSWGSLNLPGVISEYSQE